MEADTASIRKAAPNWTLAGDKQLLGMLQQIHQSIMTKCQEANTKLDAMVDALDNASIDLQNVNNKFMALSNSQFVESRVYDDDVDIKAEEITQKLQQEKPQIQPENEIQKIKLCLQKLEIMHEPVLIMDSDSSDDEESSMVLKPKDVYGHRPLPHIIGSQAWKNKWHAGLLPEDSDSESSQSNKQLEEYSDSEPEMAVDATDRHAHRTISSSSMESEVLDRSSQLVASPAAVAAELARRLAGPPPPPAPEPETILPEPTTRKHYGIDKPTPATIFPSEPPPLDAYESDTYSDDDIFAELHKKPHQNRFSEKTDFDKNVADELFGDSSKDIGNVVDYEQPNSTARGDSPLFDEVLPANPNTDKQTDKPTLPETNTKKPVGGISLFGSNKGTESIGAAILKRHQQKSSSDDDSDVTDSQTPPIKNTDVIDTRTQNKEPIKDNKKIIEDIFKKPVAKKKDITPKKIDNAKPVINKVETKPKDKKVDLFSDIFDDIDDIFTTNVSKPKIDTTKSIFDDDDLFSDVVEQTDKQTDKKETKSIFDSDDDLFKENDNTLTNKKASNMSNTSEKISKTKETKERKENEKVKSIFDDDSDDDLFSDNITKNDAKVTDLIKEKDNKNIKPIENTKTDINDVTDDDNLFSNTNNLTTQSTRKDNSKFSNAITTKQFQSPNLFDEDDDDDLFSTEQNVQTVLKTSQISKYKDAYTIENDDIKNLNIDENKSDSDLDNSINTLENENHSKSIANNIIKESNNSANVKNSEQNITSVKETIENPIKEVTIPSTSIDEDLDINTTQNIEPDKVITEENTETIQEKDTKLEENKIKDELNKDTFLDELTQKEPLFSEPVEPKEPDIFSDIFTDLPPAFEKPNEPKKSKNVNALFDDDSDDEALFFKKNDVISDEKPDLEFGNDRFRIFHDEPPDIDVDFSQKPLKSTNINEKHIDDLFNEVPPIDNEYPKQEIIESVTNTNIVQKEETIQNIDTTIEVETENKTVDITKLLEENDPKPVNISKLLEDDLTDNSDRSDTKIESKVEQIIQNIEENKPENIEQSSTEEDSPKKTIGKLKPMNFNINVNTLLPGASPKKTKTEETDGQIISTNNEETQSPETKMIKSVSFENSDSGVLDNKISKERAKIQVKRRPSTRRARLEAVRKSGIDFGSDSTDNSSSFDEPKPKEINNKTDLSQNITQKEDSIDIEITNKTDLSQNITPKEDPIQDITEIPKDVSKPTTSIDILDNTNSKIEHKTDNLTNVTDKTKSEIKSKIVYILNDEDIFSNSSQTSKTENATSNIEKIDKSDKEKDIKKDILKERKPLFDDLSDEELFGNRKQVQKAKESLFDSDSDSELFSKRVRPEKTKENKEVARVSSKEKKKTTRVSLFGDESDDDDLFASKTKVKEIKPIQKQTQSSNKSTEQVFEDPLSLLGEDDS